MSVLTDNLTLRGRTAVNVGGSTDLADWEWQWIADTFGWVRLDAGNWQAVELTEGVYTFTALDALLAKCETYGIGAILILCYANTNVASYAFTDWNYGPSTDAQVTAFANYAVATAAHVDGQNVMLEIWNEPHNDSYWLPTPDPAAYAKMARAATAAIKAAYPDMPVIAGGGLSYPDYETWYNQYPLTPTIREAVAGDEDTGPYELEYVKDVARRGGFAGADGCSFHFYQSEWPPEVVKRQLDTLRLYIPGDIVDSESGVANEMIRIGNSGYYRPNNKYHNETIGEDRAALYLVRKVLSQVAHDVKLTTIFSWRNIATDVYTESRPWPYKPQGGLDGAFNTYLGQALTGSYGLIEHDPSDPAYSSLNYVDEFSDEWYVESIDVIEPGTCYCEPSVPKLSGTAWGTGIVDYSLIDESKIGTLLNRGTGGDLKVAVAGTSATSAKVNDVVVTSAGTGYTLGFNQTVTDPDAGKATTGTINVTSGLSYDDDASCLLSGSVTTGGEMTGAYLSWSGSLPYDTQATATLVAMNVGGFYYAVETVDATVDFPIKTTGGTKCTSGVDCYGYVAAVEGGHLTDTAQAYGSIVLGTGKGLAVGTLCSVPTSLNGDGTSADLTVTVKALLHTALGICGSAFDTYWTVTSDGSGYRVGEVVTFGTYSTVGASDVAVVVTEVGATGNVVEVRGLWGGTYAPTTLPTAMQMGDTADSWGGSFSSLSTNIIPWFTPSVIKVNAAGAGYDVEPAVKITPSTSDTGPTGAGTYPGGARARAVLSNTGTVEFIQPANSSINNGTYYTVAPTVSIVAGYPSVYTRVRTFDGEVTDVFVDGPGVGLSPTQGVSATVKGGKWPCIALYRGNERKLVTADGNGANSFKITFGGQTTAALAGNISYTQLQSDLEALSSIGAGNVVCSGTISPTGITVEFQGTLANTNVGDFTLSENTASATTSTSISGHTYTVSTGYDGRKYEDGGYYVMYDTGLTSVPTVSGDLDQTIWDYVTSANAKNSFNPTCDPETGAVTALNAAYGTTYPDDNHICILGPLGTTAAVSVNLKAKPKPRQPSRKATALADLMGWIGDYEYSENLSTDAKAYHLVFTKAGENDVHVLWRTTEEVPTGTLKTINGAVVFVTIDTPGVGLTEEPEIEFLSDTGTGASAHCMMFDGGLVSGVVIDAGGTGYTDADTVRFTVPTPDDVDTPTGAVRAWTWAGEPVTLTDTITLTDEPLFVEVED